MKFSAVTISFNQAEFLGRAIRSVLEQEGVEVEYIIVDPGSTDGSREIIKAFGKSFSHIILDRDCGPADGLNKGFALATGEVFCYLNADDAFEAGAFRRIVEEFALRPEVDVLCGHAWVIDSEDRRLRRVWSDPFDCWGVAYGASIQIQPSTFIRQKTFKASRGFNIENRSNWDSELLVDLVLSGARIEVCPALLSSYRLHKTSITNSGDLDSKIKAWSKRRFRMLMGREWTSCDEVAFRLWRVWRQFRNPTAMFERLRYGPVYRRGIGS